MKIMVLNFSGNVGKTTITKHLLLPRMDDAYLVGIETINSHQTLDYDDKFSAHEDEFLKFQTLFQKKKQLLVDLGSSNYENLMELLMLYEGAVQDIDYFVVPVVPDRKQQEDTFTTIQMLLDMEIEPDKIKVVFNNVKPSQKLENVFPAIYSLKSDHPDIDISSDNTIYNTRLYQMIQSTDQTIDDLIADKTDYKKQIEDADELETQRIMNMIAMTRLAASANKNLDFVFHSLFGAS